MLSLSNQTVNTLRDNLKLNSVVSELMNDHDINSRAVNRLQTAAHAICSIILRGLYVGVLTMPVSILIKKKAKKNMNINVSLCGKTSATQGLTMSGAIDQPVSFCAYDLTFLCTNNEGKFLICLVCARPSRQPVYKVTNKSMIDSHYLKIRRRVMSTSS